MISAHSHHLLPHLPRQEVNVNIVFTWWVIKQMKESRRFTLSNQALSVDQIIIET